PPSHPLSLHDALPIYDAPRFGAFTEHSQALPDGPELVDGGAYKQLQIACQNQREETQRRKQQHQRTRKILSKMTRKEDRYQCQRSEEHTSELQSPDHL